MKIIKAKYLLAILLAVAMCFSVPALFTRLDKENDNRNVTVALLYNDIKTKLSPSMLEEKLEQYKGMGVDTVALLEEDINALTTMGDFTCIKYNVLLHKYDDESILIGNAIKEACPNVTIDAYVVVAKREKAKEKLAYNIPRRYGDDEYAYIDAIDGTDIYVLFSGHSMLWDFALGYNEEDIKMLYDKGFKISLIHDVKNYQRTEYIDDIERIIKQYDVEYINLRKDGNFVAQNDGNTENYKRLSDIITDNDMTLVVLENTNQLSNEQFYGYDYVFERQAAGKVIRAYETHDNSQADATSYKYRTSQLFNSTIDRNIRFTVITQQVLENMSYEDMCNYTVMSTRDYIQKLADEGYTINGETKALNYVVKTTMAFALSAVIMVMAIGIMLCLVFDRDFTVMCFAAAAAALIGFVVVLFIPAGLRSLVHLLPTVYSAVMSCFAMTVVLSFLKHFRERMNTILLTISALAIMMATLFFMSISMGAMLSGIDYYINNQIFRGIKLSLIAPIAYTAVAYLIMFKGKERIDAFDMGRRILTANIKVYWVIIGGFIATVAFIYLLRSGNVEKISSLEAAMRSTLTEMFTERPRTKEFLLGYPALILLCYYISKTKIKLLQWMLAIATSVLSASVTNSFCHVFTGYKIIVKRTINGFIVGMVVSAIAIVCNMILVKIVKIAAKKLKDEGKANG